MCNEHELFLTRGNLVKNENKNKNKNNIKEITMELKGV